MLPETFLHDMLYCLTSEASTTGDQLRLQHYTPMLHCALLAYGSAFSDNPELRSPALRAEFARYAKQWLDYEFERPVMGLVRALALLAEYHCGIGERSTGFMYMGMSIRAARSLILTDEHDPWLNEGVTAHSEAAERDWHFWSAFSQGQMQPIRNALEFRQEYDVPIPHLGVSLPSIDTESDGQPWSDGLVGFPPRLTTKTFFDSCKLMVISTKVISFLHGRIQETHGERAVINLHLQLDTWFNNLPRELLVWARSSSPLPHIITLHICYWFLLVCLHKPFYGRAVLADDHRAKAPNTTNEALGQGGSDPIHDLSMKMVDRAAHKIVQLLQMFEEQHGMRFFPRNMLHVIYECGVVLLKEAATVPFAATKKRATALEAGNVCLRVLKGTSRTWPWAEQLANRLEARLSEAGANIAMQPFASNWTVPAGENDQTGSDNSQTFYQFVHVWDSTGAESSHRGYPMNRASGMQPAQPGPTVHADASRATHSGQMGLGLQGVSPSHQGFGNSAMRSNLGEDGGAHVDGESRPYDMMSFSGTPTSSRSSYSLPPQAQHETDGRAWDPLFQ
ncbi:fungal specific transcription factor [Rhizoctonia solani AG-3 Rhs1AP]|uniref:Fungal specific transcription factor n=1 Tax=Rhizoctonia solani AG-3 Rhs1AP TaxID=1086054 RepID=X8J5K6_9AGAM|nr:fungal specific transcription factor [Rhizoctonia solani AG-3 Rhs1AP]